MTDSKKSSGRMLGAMEGILAKVTEKYGFSVLYQVGVVNTSHQLSMDDVRVAAKILASHQESLRMKIVKDESFPGYKFVPLENWEHVDVTVLKIEHKDDWVKIVQEETKNNYNFINGPLWGIILAKVSSPDHTENQWKHQYVIILKLHHAIGDGTSALDVLYRQYLPILSAIINKGDPNSILVEDMQLQPCMEDVIGAPELPWYMKMLVHLMMWYKVMFPKPAFTYFEHKRKLEDKSDYAFAYHPVVLPEELTANIMTAAKEHNVTVHCVITEVVTVTLCAASRDAGFKLPQKLNIVWPINARKFLGIQSPLALSACSGGGSTITENKDLLSDEDFWKMCENISESVKAQNNKEKCAFGAAFFKYLWENSYNSWEKYRMMLVEMMCSGDTMISNLGNCNNSGPEPKLTKGEVEIRLEETFLAVRGMREINHGFNFTPFYYGITTLNNKMMMNIFYNPQYVSKRFMNNLSLKFQEVALKYCSPKQGGL